MASEKSVKKLHSEDRKEPRKTQNRANNIVQELSEKWPKGRKETHSNAKEPCKSGKTTTTKTESLRTDNLVKEDLRKVPKRSDHNRKQSY